MADITNPIVVSMSNEGYRPLAEALRAVSIAAAALKTRHVNAIVPALATHVDADPLVDNRQVQGVQQVTKGQITALAAVVNGVLGELTAAGVPELLDEFAVRPPRISLEI